MKNQNKITLESKIKYDVKETSGQECAYKFSQIAVDKIRNELQKSIIPVGEYAFLDNLLDSLQKDPLNFKNSVVLMAEENYNRTNLDIIAATRELSTQLNLIAEKGISEANLNSINYNVEKIKMNVLKHEETSKNALIQWVTKKDAELKNYQNLNEAKANDIGGIELTIAASARKSVQNGVKALDNCKKEISNFQKMTKNIKIEAKTAGLFLKTAIAKISMQYYMKQINENKAEICVLENTLKKTWNKLEQYEETGKDVTKKYQKELKREESFDTAMQLAKLDQKYCGGKISRIKMNLISDAEELKRLIKEAKGTDLKKEIFAEHVIQNNIKKVEFRNIEEMMNMARRRAEERNQKQKVDKTKPVQKQDMDAR